MLMETTPEVIARAIAEKATKDMAAVIKARLQEELDAMMWDYAKAIAKHLIAKIDTMHDIPSEKTVILIRIDGVEKALEDL